MLSKINKFFVKHKNPVITKNKKNQPFFPNLSKKNTIIIDPLGDFVGNIQQAKEKYKVMFSSVFEELKERAVFIAPEKPIDIKKSKIKSLKKNYPNLHIDTPEHMKIKENNIPFYKKILNSFKNILF